MQALDRDVTLYQVIKGYKKALEVYQSYAEEFGMEGDMYFYEENMKEHQLVVDMITDIETKYEVHCLVSGLQLSNLFKDYSKETKDALEHVLQCYKRHLDLKIEKLKGKIAEANITLNLLSE